MIQDPLHHDDISWSSTALQHGRSVSDHLSLQPTLIRNWTNFPVVLEYLGYNYVQIKVKDFIYSFKLKVEIGALNSLRDFVRQFRTLDSSFQFKQQRNIQEGIQRQWESALQRAFGTVGRTRPGEPEEVHVAEGRQILVPEESSAATEGQSVEASMGTGNEKLAKDGK